MATLHNLIFKYEGAENKTFLQIGEKIDYYVSSPNYVKLTENIEASVTNNNIKTYIRNADGTYTLTTTYEENTVYYIESGTVQSSCSACGGDGRIAYEDNTGFCQCPVCQGSGKRILNNVGTPIVGISFSQEHLAAGGYKVFYKIVPVGGSKSITLEEAQVKKHTGS